MIKEYFTDNISVETMAKLIDETLTLEKNNKSSRKKINIFKIIPAVAAILLVIGLVNLLPMLNFNGGDDNIWFPSALIAASYEEVSNTKLTYIPRIVEKSVFESLLERIPKQDARGHPTERILQKLYAYYSYKDISQPDLSNRTKAELRLRFPFIERGAVYIFDPNASDREILEILSYWNEYIGWSDEDYFEMLDNYFKLSSERLTIVPRIVEKSVFDNFMANIPEDSVVKLEDRTITGESTVHRFYAYYTLIENTSDIRWQDITGEEMLHMGLFPYNDKGAFYVFDFFASDREIDVLLEVWNQCTGWTDKDYFKMLEAYDMVIPGGNKDNEILTEDTEYNYRDILNYDYMDISYMFDNDTDWSNSIKSCFGLETFKTDLYNNDGRPHEMSKTVPYITGTVYVPELNCKILLNLYECVTSGHENCRIIDLLDVIFEDISDLFNYSDDSFWIGSVEYLLNNPDIDLLESMLENGAPEKPSQFVVEGEVQFYKTGTVYVESLACRILVNAYILDDFISLDFIGVIRDKDAFGARLKLN